MIKKCKFCGKEFEFFRGNRKFCCSKCREKAYKNYLFSTPESQEKYRANMKEKLGLSESELNMEFRERTANNKGMTVSEYNAFLEEQRARRLSLTVEELRHFIYLAKKHGSSLAEELGITQEEYDKKIGKRSKWITEG